MIGLKKWLMAGVLLAGSVQAAPAPAKPRVFVSHFENVLGTSLEVKVSALAEKSADRAEEAALLEIARLDKILSSYDAGSEFSRWLATHNEPVTVSAELFDMLSLFDKWRDRTGGALNASAEGINLLWKKAAAAGRLPSATELADAVQSASVKQWTLNPLNHTATHTGNAPLRLNSFAKSYIIQRAADRAMLSADVEGVSVNIGGDIVLRGSLADPVSVTNPRASAENDAPLTKLRVTDKAVATSGDYRRGVAIGGQWYSHIVDPRTGMPGSEVISATVVASDATDAGALATVFSILSPDESRRLAAAVPGAEYLLVTKDGTQITSSGWNDIAIGTPKPALAAKPADWTDNYEIAVNFEIALIEGTRVRRPFVAIWVEDSKGQPVRNISVWYNRERWLPDLKLWHRIYGQQFNAEGSSLKTSVSSATRSPGKYTMKWDGKDDKGAEVKPGNYTVVIEAVREHGSYQLMKQEIEIKKKPSEKTYNLSGNVEIASASVELRKKS